MTQPRQILPGATYLITRRCTQRQFLLRPDEETTAIFTYCLAEAARRFAVWIYCWTTMSNHYHLVVHDPLGVLPAFLAHFNRQVAVTMNARWGRRENLWASGAVSVVRLVEASDVLDEVVYTLANPLVEDLVDDLNHWPGATSYGAAMGRREVTVERPRRFFRRGGRMPVRASIRPAVPAWPGGEEAWLAAVRAGVDRVRLAARARREATGRPIVGRKRLMRMSHREVAASPEPRRQGCAELACKSPERRVHELAALRAFRAMYAAARARWREGERSAEFPFGTYKMRVEHAAVCAAPPG